MVSPRPVGPGSLQWFADRHTLAPEKRTDRYLSFPGCETGGVKLRSYGDTLNFEIKLLRGAAEPLKLPAGVAGRADCWVKWSYGDAPAEALVQELVDGPRDGFVDVEKTRYLRKFSTDAGRPTEVEAGARPSSGCGVELAELSVRNEAWWSFAFEAFGEPAGVRATLEAVAQQFLAARRPVDPFSTANSCSYPAWLAAS